jgi:hypothetical protein
MKRSIIFDPDDEGGGGDLGELCSWTPLISASPMADDGGSLLRAAFWYGASDSTLDDDEVSSSVGGNSFPPG